MKTALHLIAASALALASGAQAQSRAYTTPTRIAATHRMTTRHGSARLG